MASGLPAVCGLNPWRSDHLFYRALDAIHRRGGGLGLRSRADDYGSPNRSAPRSSKHGISTICAGVGRGSADDRAPRRRCAGLVQGISCGWGDLMGDTNRRRLTRAGEAASAHYKPNFQACWRCCSVLARGVVPALRSSKQLLGYPPPSPPPTCAALLMSMCPLLRGKASNGSPQPRADPHLSPIPGYSSQQIYLLWGTAIHHD